MSEFGLQDEFSLRISVLSHPDGYASQLIKLLLEKYSDQSTHENISVISANISTIKLFILNNPVKIILIQPISQYFTNKLHSRFYKSLAAMILFFDHDSEVAAKVFYQIYRKIAGTTNPVAFVEVINDSNKEILINEPEILENAPYEAYHSIKSDDVNSFQRILESLVNQCYKKEH
ncbi:MAG: hypothetical protein ACFFB5_19785 [Promethearchaeota archaeon]